MAEITYTGTIISETDKKGIITSGKEIRVFVINKAKNGDHYWVLAHITPTADGYHAERQAPSSNYK